MVSTWSLYYSRPAKSLMDNNKASRYYSLDTNIYIYKIYQNIFEYIRNLSTIPCNNLINLSLITLFQVFLSMSITFKKKTLEHLMNSFMLPLASSIPFRAMNSLVNTIMKHPEFICSDHIINLHIHKFLPAPL